MAARRLSSVVLANNGVSETVRLFSRANVSDRDDDLIHEEMLDRFGDGYMHQKKRRRNNIRDARLCQQIDEAWENVVLRTPHLHDTLMGDHSLEKTGIHVYDKGKKCTVYYTCDPASQVYVAKYFATSSRWLGHRIGEQLRVKCASPIAELLSDAEMYRPQMQFVPDGLSPDGEELLEMLSSANLETLEANDGGSGDAETKDSRDTSDRQDVPYSTQK